MKLIDWLIFLFLIDFHFKILEVLYATADGFEVPDENDPAAQVDEGK